MMGVSKGLGTGKVLNLLNLLHPRRRRPYKRVLLSLKRFLFCPSPSSLLFFTSFFFLPYFIQVQSKVFFFLNCFRFAKVNGLVSILALSYYFSCYASISVYNFYCFFVAIFFKNMFSFHFSSFCLCYCCTDLYSINMFNISFFFTYVQNLALIVKHMNVLSNFETTRRQL